MSSGIRSLEKFAKNKPKTFVRSWTENNNWTVEVSVLSGSKFSHAASTKKSFDEAMLSAIEKAKEMEIANGKH